MGPTLGDRQGGQLSFLTSFQDSNRLPVKGIPISDLPVRARRQQLRLIRVVHQILEHRGFKQAQRSGSGGQIPDNTGPIGRSRHSLRVVLPQANAPDPPAVLFHRSLHGLRLGSNSPHSHFPLHAARHDLPAVACRRNGRYPVLVGVVDHVQQPTALGQERPDLPVGPPRDDLAAVSHEVDAMALHVGDLDSQQLLAGLGIPHPNVRHRARRKHLRISERKSHRVDIPRMAGVPQLGGQGVAVHPVNVRQRSPAEKMGPIRGQRQRSHRTQNLALPLHLQTSSRQLSNRPITRADQDVSAWQHRGAGDPH
mmetsp:Transcript_1749/g.3878  ORF Transcript_1749/g.3878 Transcript_1749/m.3878 type:complete len:310 (-) Transcript_1749:784-1713(-)